MTLEPMAQILGNLAAQKQAEKLTMTTKKNNTELKTKIGVMLDKEYWSIKEIADYCGVTNANIGYHINSGHMSLFNERPKLVEYVKNKVLIEGIRIKKQGYPESEDVQKLRKKVKDILNDS